MFENLDIDGKDDEQRMNAVEPEMKRPNPPIGRYFGDYYAHYFQCIHDIRLFCFILLL